MPDSPSHALLQVHEDEIIVIDLQRRVLNFATTVVATLSGLLSLLFLYHALGYIVFPAFEIVGTGTQVNAAIGLALFALTSVVVRVLNSKSASLHLSRLMTVLLALVVVNFIPTAGMQYVMPQAIWLPVLFAAATVSGSWAAITAVGTLTALAVRYSEAPVFHSPASIFVTIAIVVLILSLRWLYDAGLSAVARSHQRVLTTLRVDTLTGLPNRTRLMELLGEQQTRGDGFSGIAVARFDIDGFGAICDSIGLSLDDFGTGYASLAQLHAFEIDIVKIDRRFVSGLAEGNREQALCAGIISLAHSLGMKVTAEGVETAEQRDLLVGLGCDYAQGWLFGRPVDAAAFEARLNGGG